MNNFMLKNLDSQEEMDKFLERYKLPQLFQEERDYLNSSVQRNITCT